MAISLAPGKYFGRQVAARQAPVFKISMTQYQPHDKIRMHYHENPYLSLLINGQYQEIGEDKPVSINPGHVLFRPEKLHHSNIFGSSGGRCLNIEWEPTLFDRYEIKPAPAHMAIYSPGTLDHLDQALYCFMNGADSFLPEEYLLNWLSKDQAVQVPSRLGWLSRLKAILDHEMEDRHTIRSLADRLFLHPMYLARAFKEKEGLTIGEYQLRARIKHAVNLLYTTNKPVSDIAYASGFTDAAHFIRSFRLHYQVTPRKFRLALKG